MKFLSIRLFSPFFFTFQAGKQKKKFSSFFKSLVIELDKELYGPDNHLVEVWSNIQGARCPKCLTQEHFFSPGQKLEFSWNHSNCWNQSELVWQCRGGLLRALRSGSYPNMMFESNWQKGLKQTTSFLCNNASQKEGWESRTEIRWTTSLHPVIQKVRPKYPDAKVQTSKTTCSTSWKNRKDPLGRCSPQQGQFK